MASPSWPESESLESSPSVDLVVLENHRHSVVNSSHPSPKGCPPGPRSLRPRGLAVRAEVGRVPAFPLIVFVVELIPTTTSLRLTTKNAPEIPRDPGNQMARDPPSVPTSSINSSGTNVLAS